MTSPLEHFGIKLSGRVLIWRMWAPASSVERVRKSLNEGTDRGVGIVFHGVGGGGFMWIGLALSYLLILKTLPRMEGNLIRCYT